MQVTVESLRDRRGDSCVAFTKFSSAFYDSPKALFCFFEGKDNPYYMPRLEHFRAKCIFPICCNGKAQVLKVYNLIMKKPIYKESRKAFFIDRDFDHSVDVEPYIYETPYYSIENFYVSPKVFEKILQWGYSINRTDKDFDKLMTLYKTMQKDFHKAICLLNAWYACVREKQLQNDSEERINLKNILKKEYVDITLNQVKQNYSLDTLIELFPDAPVISDEAIQLKHQDFVKNRSKYKVFRGKWEVWFLCQFIELVNNNKRLLGLEKKLTLHGTLSNERVISAFASCAETPTCLKRYIRKILSNKRN